MNTYSLDKMYESYSNEVERMQKYIDELLQENKQLKNKIKELVKYGFGTDMSLREFKEFYKLGRGKDYDPKNVQRWNK